MRRILPALVVAAAACAHAAAEPRSAIMDEVEAQLAGAGATYYEFGGSGRRGEGALDCSGYTNRVLARAAPRAFASLRALRSRPRSTEYVERIELGGDGWSRIARVPDLQPGDIIAWRHRPGTPTKDPRSTGHVAFVVGRPVPDGGGLWRVRVSDSARSGHSDDTRRGASGVGAGTILVGTTPSGEARAVAWSLRGRFETPEAIALGRPSSR